MKRLVSLMVVSMMAVLLSGCGQESPKQTDIKPEATTTTETVVQPQPAAAPEAAKPADEQAAPAAPTQE